MSIIWALIFAYSGFIARDMVMDIVQEVRDARRIQKQAEADAVASRD